MTHYGFLSTYPPTRCGLATFTQALARALTVDRRDTAVVVRVLETDDDAHPRDIRASARVGAELIAGDPRSMADAVESLDDCDVAIVQHEYGIYGGQDGDEILDVLAAVTTPTIVVLHTVLPAPTAHQRLVLERVCDLAAGIVVMTSGAREILTEHYDVDAADVHVIPHGVANVAVEVAGPHLRKRILTWGLISPGKGIEWGIRAIAQLADLDHEVEYVVAGQTHPKVLAHAGESYRAGLTDLIGELGIDTSVHLDGRYLDAGELAVLVASADVVLLPYDSRDQATSGVLAEAVAAGIPVVATGFPHAVELLAGGAGIVVAHEDPQSMASALRTILTADDVARRMRDVALRAAGETSWPAVASRYRLLSQDLRTAVAA